jgi:hypothetical protein
MDQAVQRDEDEPAPTYGKTIRIRKLRLWCK